MVDHIYKVFLGCFFVLLHGAALCAESNYNLDLIIFSYKRPMQLYAVLEGVGKYFSNINKIYVLYRIDSSEHEIAYSQVQQRFSHVEFVKQGSNPRSDFKPLLLQCLFASPADYIMFSVDDDIVKDYADMHECTKAIDQCDAHGFYLRIGTNINMAYRQNVPLPQPPYVEVQPGILKFRFKDATSGSDWDYSHNVDMTIYKKSVMGKFLQAANYSSPNTLEEQLQGFVDMNRYGLCFKSSKKFVLPLNIVQLDWQCPHSGLISAQELLNKWNAGFKIDINRFFQINNNCVLMNYSPVFIPRNE